MSDDVDDDNGFMLYSKSDMEMQVVLGGVDIEKSEVYDQIIPVERAHVHEEYKETPFALHNDVGKLEIIGAKLKSSD